MRTTLCAVLALTMVCGLAEAQVTSLEGARLGSHWMGPQRTMDDLKGRVVVVEMWGYN